ncbi:MAG TPA: hypothetical protein RMF84_12710 [Polyangiaceae bacterium LLY-WYZ-14_1]|nr:hypothetical protein [Polyangiaceae bacterium LLY-WYZ-14_1]
MDGAGQGALANPGPGNEPSRRDRCGRGLLVALVLGGFSSACAAEVQPADRQPAREAAAAHQAEVVYGEDDPREWYPDCDDPEEAIFGCPAGVACVAGRCEGRATMMPVDRPPPATRRRPSSGGCAVGDPGAASAPLTGLGVFGLVAFGLAGGSPTRSRRRRGRLR